MIEILFAFLWGMFIAGIAIATWEILKWIIADQYEWLADPFGSIRRFFTRQTKREEEVFENAKIAQEFASATDDMEVLSIENKRESYTYKELALMEHLEQRIDNGIQAVQAVQNVLVNKHAEIWEEIRNIHEILAMHGADGEPKEPKKKRGRPRK